MTSFAATRRRLAQYRICLERDTRAGIVPLGAADEIERCFHTVGWILESARVEIEAAGPVLSDDPAFLRQFIGGCSTIGLRMFQAMYQESSPRVLACEARRLRAEARELMEQLWTRLGRAA